MTFLLAVKWILAPASVLLGCASCYVAYLKPPDKRRFQFRDLFETIFTRHRVGDQTKVQLVIEGILGIALGVALFMVL
jgi:hypothetical protein